MSEEAFTFPPGMRPATEWLDGSIPSTAEAIQRDAVMAARREAKSENVKRLAEHREKFPELYDGAAWEGKRE